MSCHKKGPWKKNSRGDLLSKIDGRRVVVWGDGLASGERSCETEANGRLISLAPEMYELIELVHGSFGGGRTVTFSDDDIAAFEDVILKMRCRR